jgi:hypothetical protein
MTNNSKPMRPGIVAVTDLFAFWRYDLYPYVLGAPITRMDDNGNAFAPSYQAWFHPIKIMPLEAGKALGARLEQMRAEHRAARALLDTEWNKALFDLLPEARNPGRTYAGFPRKVDDKK